MLLSTALHARNFIASKGFLFILALIFSANYILASHLDPQSYILYDPKVSMDIVYFRARFLLPILLKSLLPNTWLDTTWLRFVIAFVFSSSLFLLIQPFCRRLRQQEHIIKASPLLLFIILTMHYAITQPLNVYYVYDIPSIFFYVVSFLLLTDQRRPVFLFGIASVLFFALNRETVIIAAFQAAGYGYFASQFEATRKEMWYRFALLGGAIGGALLIKAITLHCLGAGSHDFILVQENGTFRLWANIKRVAFHPTYAIQLVVLGCGMLFWFPILYKKLSRLELSVVLFTLPTLPAYLMAENLTELRGYNEFVPLIAVLLGRYVLDVLQYRA